MNRPSPSGRDVLLAVGTGLLVALAATGPASSIVGASPADGATPLSPVSALVLIAVGVVALIVVAAAVSAVVSLAVRRRLTTRRPDRRTRNDDDSHRLLIGSNLVSAYAHRSRIGALARADRPHRDESAIPDRESAPR